MKIRVFFPYIIVIIMLITGTFFDYQIDAFLYDPTNLFGIFFEEIILIPFMLLLPLTMALLYRVHRHICYLLLQIAFSVYIVHFNFQYFIDIELQTLLIIPISLLIIAICSIFVKCFDIYTLKRVEKHAVFFVCVFLTAMFFTTLIKLYWGRVRFRELETAAQFSVWYLPQGNTGHHSFPSAHTTAFSSILCLLSITRKNHYQKTNKLIWIIVCVGITAMMFARMIVGAHYLSDVAVGFAITYTIFLMYQRKFYREVLYEG